MLFVHPDRMTPPTRWQPISIMRTVQRKCPTTRAMQLKTNKIRKQAKNARIFLPGICPAEVALFSRHRPCNTKAANVRTDIRLRIPSFGTSYFVPMIGVAIAPHRTALFWLDHQRAFLILENPPRFVWRVLPARLLAPTPHIAVGVE